MREKGLQTTTRKVGGGESEETSSGHVVGNQAKDLSPKSLVKDR